MNDQDLDRRAAQIQWIGFDVDGVMTDGGLIYDEGGHESKRFHSRDGVGLKLLLDAGITVAVITGRRSPVVSIRMQELGIRHVVQGCTDKRQACQKLIDGLGLSWEQCAYMGDDLPDLALMKHCGLALTVADAPDSVRSVADWVTSARGGSGAVREMAEWLLIRRGDWERVMEKWVG